MRRIEYRDLLFLGASNAALDLYSSTDPLKIVEKANGTFHISGAFGDVDFSSGPELIEYLEDFAKLIDDE